MTHHRIRHLLVAAAWLVVAAVTALWSWNTIAELFGVPEAGIRHVVAAFALILLAKFTFQSGHRHHALRSRRR